MRRPIILALIVFLTASSVIGFQNTSAQSIPKPHVPEFTLTLIEQPYDVPPTTTIDPYTGQSTTIQEGQQIQNKTIKVIIKDQTFAAYQDANGKAAFLSYNISVKGHYANEWDYYPNAYWKIPIMSSNSGDTVVSFGLTYSENDPYSYRLDVPDNGSLDFRVEGQIGYYTEEVVPFPVAGGEYHKFTFVGETSGWSPVQTITINDSTVKATSSPNPSSYSGPTETHSQNNSKLNWIALIVIGLLAAIVVLLVFVVVYLRKRSLAVTPR